MCFTSIVARVNNVNFYDLPCQTVLMLKLVPVNDIASAADYRPVNFRKVALEGVDITGECIKSILIGWPTVQI